MVERPPCQGARAVRGGLAGRTGRDVERLLVDSLPSGGRCPRGALVDVAREVSSID